MESRIQEAILSVVPLDGSRIGNQSLVREAMEAGEAERQRISVPTVPLFAHERH